MPLWAKGSRAQVSLKTSLCYPLAVNDGDVLAKFHYYEIIRSYIVHEDDLVNSRLTWCLTINGFLFTALAVLGQRAVDLTTGNMVGPESASRWWTAFAIFVALTTITALGAIVSSLASRAVAAANYSLESLDALIHGDHGPDNVRTNGVFTLCVAETTTDKLRLPRIIGGGAPDNLAHARAGQYYLQITRLIAFVWFIIAALCIFGMSLSAWHGATFPPAGTATAAGAPAAESSAPRRRP